MDAVALLSSCQREIGQLCRAFGVRRLRLFGSAARGGFDAGASDFDFLVEFDAPVGRNRFQQYMRFKLDLERLLGRPVDLVLSAALRDPRLRAAAESGALELYAA